MCLCDLTCLSSYQQVSSVSFTWFTVSLDTRLVLLLSALTDTCFIFPTCSELLLVPCLCLWLTHKSHDDRRREFVSLTCGMWRSVSKLSCELQFIASKKTVHVKWKIKVTLTNINMMMKPCDLWPLLSAVSGVFIRCFSFHPVLHLFLHPTHPTRPLLLLRSTDTSRGTHTHTRPGDTHVHV